jgi:hypothetical protein
VGLNMSPNTKVSKEARGWRYREAEWASPQNQASGRAPVTNLEGKVRVAVFKTTYDELRQTLGGAVSHPRC